MGEAGRIRVGELVDQYDARLQLQQPGQIQLVELASPVRDLPGGKNGKALKLLGEGLAPMGLDEADDDVGAGVRQPASLLQAGIRLSDGWSCAKEDMEASASSSRPCPDPVATSPRR